MHIFLINSTYVKVKNSNEAEALDILEALGFIFNNLINSLIVKSDSFNGLLMGEFRTGSLKMHFLPTKIKHVLSKCQALFSMLVGLLMRRWMLLPREDESSFILSTSTYSFVGVWHFALTRALFCCVWLVVLVSTFLPSLMKFTITNKKYI